MATAMLGSPSGLPDLPPSPPYSPKRDDVDAHLDNNDGLDESSRSASGSSLGQSSTMLSSTQVDAGPSTYPTPSPEPVKVKQKRRVQLEDFELVRVLGKGCAGRVLLVKQTRTNTIHAMKAISKRSVLTHDELDHTLTELSILKRFATQEPGNLFVSKLYCSFTDRENIYFVLEFYPGGDLATQMEIHGVLGDHRTRFYAADITQGLEDLHRHGIIVRDLKPENILLNSRGHCVLADFGLSKEFPYRGEPQKVHVVTYPGQPALPAWAGAGAGSLRAPPGGTARIKVDKAYSFVGTSEYLSPEVVKRGEYSYAVDWWALGCIVLEGLVGRVPFRKTEEEPPIVLWEQILSDRWDKLFREPKMAPYALDPVTYSFLDALLQKDPMWRLTEPHVKAHDYFGMLDWETVKRGEYQDPHGLHLHAVAEYNTRYFPKLCLEEEPSVDMSTHDLSDLNDFKPTPLNDNQLYAIEQAKHWAELQSFTWCPEEVFEEPTRLREDSADMSDVEQSIDVPEVVLEDEGESEALSNRDVSLSSKMDESFEAGSQGSGDSEYVEEDGDETVAQAGVSLENIPDVPASTDVNYIDATPQPIHSSLYPPSLSSSLPKTPNTIISSLPDQTNEEHNPNSPVASKSPLANLSPLPDAELPSLPAPIRRPTIPAAAPNHAQPVPIGGLPKPRAGGVAGLVLPSGLPSSGLSVSDVMSIPSPGLGSPARLIRRHPQRQSLNSESIPRLSVEMHGTITHIEDEDWEELTIEGPDASAPNGPNHPSIFARGLGGVLRRKPSTLATSGLRRQTKTSDSSRDSSSPTKPRPTLFTAKSIESTKKALGKLKTFPKLGSVTRRERDRDSGGSTPLVSLSTETVQREREREAGLGLGLSPPQRPSPSRRHTESGWFERRKKGKLSTHPPTSTSTSVPPTRSSKASATSVDSSIEGDPPRLELRDTGKLTWEFDGEEWGMKR